MSNKMLIDASHPEETRVAVVRGNRIEEYDFESQEKKQLRGNIYLAKVTRVEPSLQAAFVDYGGNRHGFLAFSEIHPDYYQIPVADRQALLEAEAAEARAMREAEEAEDEDSEDTNSESKEEENEADASTNNTDEAEEPVSEAKPKPKSRRRRSAKSAVVEASEDGKDVTSNKKDDIGSDEDTNDDTEAKVEAAPEPDADQEAEPAKPKRRTTRRRKPKTEDGEGQSEDNTKSSDDDNDAGGSPSTMAAMVEMDEISEPLPEDEDNTGDQNDDTAAEEEPAVEEKPKRKRATRSRKKKVETEPETVEAKPETSKEETETEVTAENASPEEASDGKEETTEDTVEEPKRKRRSSRRSSSRKKKATEEAVDADDSDEDDDNGNSIESVGQDDALEEVPAQRSNYRQYKIQEVIKRRQVLLIQVVKEERGNKGAALTTYLSLAGRYSVLMPNTARGGGISRKITNSADRKRLKTIASELDVPEGMGVILRTAGAARTKDEIERDFQYLMRLWGQVRNLTLASTAPCLVYEEGSLIKRSIRDLYNKDTDEITVAGDEGFKEAKDFMEMLMPDHIDRVKQYQGSQAIFNKYGVENHLENMVSPQVTLKSGGYLVINQTEALVAVDVNSGRATREHSVEKTALQTNLEAAEEVARQLKLRDLAGLIVIDFIDMEERRNNRAVEKKLKECLKNDRARIQVGRISHFGLMEMSRQRIRASVLESTMDVCPHCAGIGFVRSESAIALHVFRALEEHVTRNRNRDAVLRTTPAIASHMLNHKRAALVELEQRFGVQVIVLGQHEITGQDFHIEKGEKSTQTTNAKVVGYEGDSHSEPADSEEAEGKGRKRGRRRRRKGKSDEALETAAETTEATDENTSDAVEVTGDETEEEKPRKKRRRGKRGGSRRIESDENGVTETSETDASETNETSEVEVEETAKPEPSASDEVAEESKPKSRSTRRKKAPVAAKEAPSEASEKVENSADSEAAKPTEEPPRPKRRTTRRKKEVVAESDTTEPDTVSAESNEGTAESPDSVAAPESNSESSDAPEEETKPKRRGWWNRGDGGFF